ncbi:MAG: ribonuclease Y [Candidatus Jorgensenbacteria bacterium]
MILGTSLPVALGLVALGVAIGYLIRRQLALGKISSLERKIQEKSSSAEQEAKEVVLAAKTQAASILTEAQKEERERKHELRRLEERLLNKEDSLEKQRVDFESQEGALKKEQVQLKEKEEDFKNLEEKIKVELEKVSGLTREEAKSKLFEEIQKSHGEEMVEMLGRFEREKKEAAEAKALDVITSSIQRYARNHVADITTSIVNLPNEDIKGKIIGREGRNIRTFERLTGVEVIIDETPESLLLSSFDPLRREVARIALEKLIADGRIQPAKIEEKFEEAKEELEERIGRIGEEATYEVGILDLPKEILKLLGRLNYRTSYGQNVLTHSIEMTHIAGMMASELGLNVEVTKKGALLHDIGKAIDHEVDGTHVELGRKILQKYGVAPEVIKAMEAHHEEYPFSSPESYVVAAADAISAARPGARRDTLEKYLKRLEDIEKVVKSFSGVRDAYAVSAGREVRVFVTPEKIDDFGALQLAKQIAGKIKSDVNYPGEIKVTVIREIKAVEYAR